jgi:hypothetical protein
MKPWEPYKLRPRLIISWIVQSREHLQTFKLFSEKWRHASLNYTASDKDFGILLSNCCLLVIVYSSQSSHNQSLEPVFCIFSTQYED